MKLRNLLMASAILFSCNAFAQQTLGPSSVSQGTFVGTTIALRDMPSVTEMEDEGFEYAREIKQKFDPSQKNAVINENDLPLRRSTPWLPKRARNQRRSYGAYKTFKVLLSKKGRLYPQIQRAQ